MIAGIVIAWFLLGLLGIHLGLYLDKAQDVDSSPSDVWMSLLGPGCLVVVLIAVGVYLKDEGSK